MNKAGLLIRLANLLQVRGEPVEPILDAVQTAGTSGMILCVSALSRRVDLFVALSSEAIARLVPNVDPGPLPPRGMLRISADGPTLGVAVTTIGPSPSVPAAVEPLLSFPGSWLMNHTRWLTSQRTAFSVAFPKRDPELDAQLVTLIDEHAARLGSSEAQRGLFKSLHRVANTGEPLSVSTELGAKGPVGALSVLYGRSEWDRAIDLLELMVEPRESRDAAATLGTLAAELGIARPRGLEVVLGPEEARELVVWLMPD